MLLFVAFTFPQYRHDTLCVSSVSFGAFSLILAHYVCDSNVTEESVSISSVAGVLHTVIVTHVWLYNVVTLVCISSTWWLFNIRY